MGREDGLNRTEVEICMVQTICLHLFWKMIKLNGWGLDCGSCFVLLLLNIARTPWEEDDALANTSLLFFTYSMSNCRVCIVIELGVIGLELAQKKTGRCSITRGLAAQN